MLINKLEGSVPNPGFAEIPRTAIASAVESSVDVTVKGALHSGVERVTFNDNAGKVIAALTNVNNSTGWLKLDAEGGKSLGELIPSKKAIISFPNKGTLYSLPAFDRQGKPRTFKNKQGVDQPLFDAHLADVTLSDLITK
jgi:hypothetical protein